MRKTVYAVLGAALFLSMGSAVLADAPDPGVPQPFGVYCDPYLSAFTEGGYYVPTDGGSCTYSFGNFASSTVVMATYKGVPGDSVPVGQFNNSTAANSQYVFITSPNNFLSLDIPPVAGDDLFSVVYAVDTGAQFFAAHGYFTTGSDAPPPNLQIIHWKWGVPLTTTADSFTITYGDAIPTLTYSFSGFAGSDNAGSNDVTGSASCTTTATASSPAGTYPITCTQGTLASITYGFPTFVPGTLTINKASLTVTADNKSMNSGSSVPALTATLSGFVNGDTSVTGGVTGSASCSTTATSASSAGTYPITCTAGTLASTKYTFDTFVAGTLTVGAVADHAAPVITITNPLKNGVYAKTDTVYLTATVVDQSALATTTYWFGNKKINPAQPLPLSTVSTPSVQSVSVSAKDVFGNVSTSTLKFFVVKNTNSCLLDIIQVLVLITQDKTLPDKPTIQNLIADCSALLKGLHRYDDDGHHH